VRLLLESADISRPVDVVRLLAQHGLSLKKAHSVLERLASGERIPVELATDRSAALISELLRLGVTARTLREPRVDVKKLRESQGLTQSEFAALYGLELDTLQNWEQGRNAPDRPTMVLLKLIETTPQAVLDVVTADAESDSKP
jgi:DNA-binding transcriptional regulator YiaG